MVTRKIEDLMVQTEGPGAAISTGFGEVVVVEAILIIADGEGALAEVEVVVVVEAEEVGNEEATSRLMTLGQAVVGIMLRGASQITMIMCLMEKGTVRHFQLWEGACLMGSEQTLSCLSSGLDSWSSVSRGCNVIDPLFDTVRQCLNQASLRYG